MLDDMSIALDTQSLEYVHNYWNIILYFNEYSSLRQSSPDKTYIHKFDTGKHKVLLTTAYIYKHTIVVVAVLSVRFVYLLMCDINANNKQRNQDIFSITAKKHIF
jgi:hypothetical protein